MRVSNACVNVYCIHTWPLDGEQKVVEIVISALLEREVLHLDNKIIIEVIDVTMRGDVVGEEMLGVCQAGEGRAYGSDKDCQNTEQQRESRRNSFGHICATPVSDGDGDENGE